MKKRMVVLVLGMFLAGVAFAQLSVSGQFQYGALSNFKDAPGIGWDNQLIFTNKIDPFNTATVRFRMRNYDGSSALATDPKWKNFWLLSSDAPFVDRAYLTTDLTGALGVKGGVKNVLTSGFAYVSTADLTDGISPFEVADLDSDNYIAMGGGKQAVFSSVLTIADAWNLRFAIAPNDFSKGLGGWFVSFDGSLPVGPGTLYPEVVFSANNGAAADKGNLVLAAKYEMSAGDVAFAIVPQYLYALDSDALVQYYYAVAAKVGYKDLAALSAGFVGMDGSEANRAEARLLLTPVKKAGIDIGAIFNLDKDMYVSTVTGKSSTLNELDISGFVMLGATKVRLGYLYLGEEGYSSWINMDLTRIGNGGSALKQGGMYLEVTVGF
ncbi:MAG: hypothetical protein N2442_04375 [Spirochaetes bacterium]|nr:hypothetical protein [Spirochaetota bacterium]